VELAGSYICHWIDTFYRAQIGYGTSGDDPYYSLLDLLVIPITDNHLRAISDVLDYNTPLEIFPFGVPHMKDEMTLEYYRHGITRLKERLEQLTGSMIMDSSLREAIALCNRERELLREISLLRRSKSALMSSRDFVALNHGSCFADKAEMVRILEVALKELKQQPDSEAKGPRILLTGSTLALGDNKVLDIIEEAGGVVVVEEFAEGIKPYWIEVSLKGDHMKALAEAYFWKRVPPAWFRPGKERLDFLIQLVRDFRADGVVWYQLMYRESYKTEAYYFPDRLRRETGLSMLSVESDYDAAEVGQLRTKIDTYVETLRS
jgi:benzoyl-CoA reductase/2-hydroxyglutaryl-CoA dehydratase subunit BcrC/BadD/HgdB